MGLGMGALHASLMKTKNFWFLSIALIASILLSDLLTFMGGYYGAVSMLVFSIVKILSVGLTLLLMGAKAIQSAKSGYRRIAVSLLVACGILVIYTERTWGGYRDPFFLGIRARIRSDLPLSRLPAWAAEVISTNRAKEDVFIPPKDLPSFLVIGDLPRMGAFVRNKAGTPYVEVAWGTGMAGKYGIAISPAGLKTDFGLPLTPEIRLFRAP